MEMGCKLLSKYPLIKEIVIKKSSNKDKDLSVSQCNKVRIPCRWICFTCLLLPKRKQKLTFEDEGAEILHKCLSSLLDV